ncbi:MAG: DMT family transporter [Verrucomicrobiales bacterium]|nr:DMT family transporter [Verrucomicrobiales bacterium]
MSPLDFVKLLLLSAIWGGSFLFMRIAAPEFGPFVLIWFRVAVAFLLLSPLLARKRVRKEVFGNPGKMMFVGIFNAALPWCLLAFAVLSLEAGFTSLLNAATPIFAAIIGFIWMKQPLTRWQTVGLILGICGVFILASDKLSLDSKGPILAIIATLGATICYGFISQYIKKDMSHLSPWSITIGNLMGATLILTPFAIGHLPESLPGTKAFVCATALGVLSTALAFVLLFDILSRSGATATTTVTFIIPIFGVLFGTLFLQEVVTARIIAGMLVAFAGAALTTKLLPRKVDCTGYSP